MSDQKDHIKGRGAQFNPDNRFAEHIPAPETFDDVNQDFEESPVKTQYIEVFPKSIINKVDSPDIGMAWSMNPYQGCEHGCVYCYARNTHPYWGYSSGLDFESKIMVKPRAAELLDQTLARKTWKAEPIMFSGNTDCYQPIEQKLEITRKMLEVLWKYRHPVGIITKNSLVLRDTDILKQMAEHDLVRVVLSINGVDESIRRKLEPRTASYKKRFETVEKLSAAGIPTIVMIAPVVPGLNDHEIFDIVERSADAGAVNVHHIVVRLNGDVGHIFEDWLSRTYPDRSRRILNSISSMHGGKVNDSEFGRRMRGEGNVAEMIADQVRIAKRKFLPKASTPPFNLDLYEQFRDRQMKLF